MMITLKSFIIGWGENDDLRKLFDMAFDFSNKKRKNHCMAMNIGEYMLCGKPCEDVFCHKHMLQIKVLRMIPRPCRVCGIGVINTYCSPCILETRTREQSLRLAKEFEAPRLCVGEKTEIQRLYRLNLLLQNQATFTTRS